MDKSPEEFYSDEETEDDLEDDLEEEIYKDPRVVRNYKCTKKLATSKNHEIINKCARNVKNVIIKKVLGKGSFGTVFFANLLDSKGKELPSAVKIIKLKKNKRSKVDEMMYEVEYSYYMGENGIGPKIYDAFYVDAPDYIMQYIFMESGDDSVMSALQSNMDPRLLQALVRDCIRLTWKQINKLELYCLDIKPNNFIYKMNKGGPKVRMIDFGAEWCKLNKLPKVITDVSPNKKISKQLFFVIVMLQFFMIIHLNIPEAYCDIYKPFFENEILKHYLNDLDEIEKLIQYITIYDNYIVGHIFSHYASKEEPKEPKELAKDVVKSIRIIRGDCFS